MEKKTAIVVINKQHFHSERIFKYNNDERIAWFANVVDDDITIHDSELVTVFDTVEEYCHEYNAGCMRSEDFDIIPIVYTDKVGGKFQNTQYPIYDLSMRLCVKISQQKQNDTDIRNIAIAIREEYKKHFGDDTQCVINGYNNDTWDYRLHIYLLGDKCRILNNLHDFIFMVHDICGVCFCEPEWSVDGKDLSAIRFDGDEYEYDEEVKHPADNMPIVPEPIKVENPKVVDTDTLAPQMEIKSEEKKEEVKENRKYDGDFLDHVVSIFEEGHRVILVDVSGEKYVLNGLFDNDDVIIDCYVADTMQRIDRYFIVGAQEAPMDEAESYAEYFARKVVKDRYVGGCWFLTDKQFEFLKNA